MDIELGHVWWELVLEDWEKAHTSAALGTLSQKTSILMSPSVVCSVTDMMRTRANRIERWRECYLLKLGVVKGAKL